MVAGIMMESDPNIAQTIDLELLEIQSSLSLCHIIVSMFITSVHAQLPDSCMPSLLHTKRSLVCKYLCSTVHPNNSHALLL